MMLGFLSISEIYAQSTEFTYQGSLKDGGVSPTASYDFEFKLFDAITGGNQIGSVASKAGVAVTDGIFSVRLDFGSNFPGLERYLEISVKPAGGGSFTILDPRQKIVSVPYAIQSKNADFATNAVTATNAQFLGGLVASQYILYSDPRLVDARPPTAGSTNYIQNSSVLQSTSNFNISGTGTANTFNATNRLLINGKHALSNTGLNNLFAGENSGLVNTGNYNAFFGAGAGLNNKGGSNNAFFGASAGESNSTGNFNTFSGVYAGNANTVGNENSFFGHRAGVGNISGDKNSFFGTYAGTFNSTGRDNSFYGNSAGYTNNGDNNAFFGSFAGNQNSSGSGNSYFGTFAGQLTTTGSNNAFVGISSGLNNAAGNNNAFFGSNSGYYNQGNDNSFFGKDSGYFTTSGSSNAFFGNRAGRENITGQLNTFIGSQAGQGNSIGSNNTLIGANATLATGNLNFATAIGSGATVSTDNTMVLGRNADSVSVPGNLNVSGTFTAGTMSVPASSITGILAPNHGGTGLGVVGAPGNFLRSDGTNWVSSPIGLTDFPAGSTFYIQNGISQQASSNFNISGNGTVGGALSANYVNSVTNYRIGNLPVFSIAGTSNLFIGVGTGLANTGSGNSFAGRDSGIANTSGNENAFFGLSSGQGNTTGSSNSFFGANTGLANTSGSNNTLLGSNTNFGAANLTYASAIGAGASVSTSNTVVIGRNVDTVRIPGGLVVSGSFTGSFTVPAANITGILAPGNGGTGLASSGGAANFLRGTAGGGWVSSPLLGTDLPGGSTSYIQNGVGLQASSNFNISGIGTVGGAFSANSVNSTTNYRIGNVPVISVAGTNNFFGGVGAGSANTGDGNAFVGRDAGIANLSGGNNAFFGLSSGAANTTGSGNSFFGGSTGSTNTIGTNNTLVGSNTNFGAPNLNYASAFGAGATVGTSNTLVLGRSADTVRIPGNLNITGTLTAGTFAVAASSITGIVAAANGGTGLATSGGAANFLRGTAGGGWISSPLVGTDIPGGSTSYIQNGTGLQASSNFNISGNGTVGGAFSANTVDSTVNYRIGNVPVMSISGTNNFFGGVSAGASNTGTANTFVGRNAGFANLAGANNAFFGHSSGTANTTGSDNTFVGDNAGAANTTGSNNTIVGSGANLGSNNLTYATAIGADSTVTTSNSVVLGRAADTVRVPGNLNVTGTFTAGTLSVAASNITGILGSSNGGTGLATSGGAANFLRGTAGGGWISSPLVGTDIPGGSTSYIQNGTGLQASSNFNISGTGTVGGVFSANSVNSSTVYNIGNTRVLSSSGTENIFVGANTAVNGTQNSFFGANSGAANSTGSSLTMLGANTNVTNNALSFATAVGAGATVGNNNSVVLGRAVDTVRVPGNLNVSGSITGTFLVPAGSITGTLSRANGGTGLSVAGANNNFLRSDGTNWVSSPFTAADIPTGSANYIQNSQIQQPSSFFNISGNGTIGGNLTVGGTITGTFSVGASQITSGTLPIARGGTGITSAGASGNVLRSDGSAWTSSPLQPWDLPSGSSFYIRNDTVQQTATNFNISGNGTAGGIFSGNTINTVTHFTIGGQRVFSTTGTNNVFAGEGTGTAGSGNSFFGRNSGATNATGNSNTMVGASADVGSGALNNSTAIGANAQVTQDNSLVLGSINGTNGGTANTSVGIGTTSPKATLDVRNGNILIGTPGQGVILRSPDGNTCKLLGIDNAGVMTLTNIACPAP